jgi:hypothetical protein
MLVAPLVPFLDVRPLNSEINILIFLIPTPLPGLAGGNTSSTPSAK